MKMSRNGILVLQKFEDCRLVAYPDPGSPLGKALTVARIKWSGTIPDRFRGLSGAPWTIGWGDTGPDVVYGLFITQENADARLARRLAREFEPAVDDALQNRTTQGQFDAFVDLAYNIGVDAFRGSTALRRHQLGDADGAAEAIGWWNKSGDVTMLGLRRRRLADQYLYRGHDAATAIAAAERLQ